MQMNERLMNFAQLVAAQDELNELTVPNWKNKRNKFEYITEAILELVELVTESNVKHKWWKKEQAASVNDWNVKIELIDALHFIMSAHILAIREVADFGGNSEEYRTQIEQQLHNVGTASFIGSDVVKLAGGELPPQLVNADGWLNYEQFVKQIISGFSVYMDSNLNYIDLYRYSFVNILEMVNSIGLTSLEISAVYTAKMTLNQIRQSSGYKDGSYVKVVDGVEDNERLKSLVDAFIADDKMTLARLAKNVRNSFFASKI